MYLLHPTLTIAGFKFFACSRDLGQGHKYLLEDFTIRCFESSHLGWALGVGLPILLFYTVGLPLATVYRLRRMQKTKGMLDAKRIKRYGFLFRGYKPKNGFWEVRVAIKKTSFAFVTVVLPSIGTDWQTAIALVVLCLSLAMQAYYSPYIDPRLNWAENLANGILIATLVMGLFLFSSDAAQGLKTFCEVIIVGMNVVFVGYIAWCMRPGAKGHLGQYLEKKHFMGSGLGTKDAKKMEATASPYGVNEVEMVGDMVISPRGARPHPPSM